MRNYSARNSFLQAEEAFSGSGKSYGMAYTGSKGFCILNVNPKISTITLSGDVASLDMDATYSVSLGDIAKSMCTKVVSVDGNVVKIEPFISELIGYSIKTEDEMIDLFLHDDNAFYAPKCPEVGNQIIENFYGNHAEGGSTRAIGKYAHAEGRDTVADVRYSHAEGSHTVAGGMAAHADGFQTSALGKYSHSSGWYAQANDDYSYVWNCNNSVYRSHGNGTYNINPNKGLSGFYIGGKSLFEHIGGSFSKALVGKTFDLNSGGGMIDAISAIVVALGGQIK